MRDWCIVTGATGPHEQFLGITVPTIAHYADEWDMDVRMVPLEDFRQVLYDPDVPPSWVKIPLLHKLLDEGYEGVLWIDADAGFVRVDEDIRPLVTAPWNWVHNRYETPGQPCVPCCGVLAVTQGAQPYLDHVWAMRDEYRDHPWWEQMAALRMFGWDEPSGELVNGGGQASLPARWNSTPASPADDPVIFHASGVFPVDARVSLLRGHLTT